MATTRRRFRVWPNRDELERSSRKEGCVEPERLCGYCDRVDVTHFDLCRRCRDEWVRRMESYDSPCGRLPDEGEDPGRERRLAAYEQRASAGLPLFSESE